MGRAGRHPWQRRADGVDRALAVAGGAHAIDSIRRAHLFGDRLPHRRAVDFHLHDDRNTGIAVQHRAQ
jgi:hypothetical protein